MPGSEVQLVFNKGDDTCRFDGQVGVVRARRDRARGALASIAARASIRLDGRVDRFRLRNGRAIEEFVTFDTQPLREALTAVPAR